MSKSYKSDKKSNFSRFINYHYRRIKTEKPRTFRLSYLRKCPIRGINILKGQKWDSKIPINKGFSKPIFGGLKDRV